MFFQMLDLMMLKYAGWNINDLKIAQKDKALHSIEF